MSKIVIIDFSWVFNRFYYIAEQRTNNLNDLYENHVKSLYNLFKCMTRDCTSYQKLFVVMDGSLENNELRSIYKEYKANRASDKKDKVYKYINATAYLINSISDKIIFLKNKNREADEVIAALTLKYHNKECVIYSGDKDMLQLTSRDNVHVSDKYSKGVFEYITDKEIFDKFKNSKKEPFTRISENKRDILKYRVFKGDTSDNIPPPIFRLRDDDIKTIIKECWTEDKRFTSESIARISVKLLNLKKEKLSKQVLDSMYDILRNYRLMSLYEKDKDALKGCKILFKNIEEDKLSRIKRKFKIC